MTTHDVETDFAGANLSVFMNLFYVTLYEYETDFSSRSLVGLCSSVADDKCICKCHELQAKERNKKINKPKPSFVDNSKTIDTTK